MAPPTKSLRSAVSEELGIRPQSLDDRVQSLRRKLPMTPQDATAVIGFRSGVDIARWLDADSLVRVAGYVKQLSDVVGSEAKSRSRSSRRSARAPAKDVIITIGGVSIGKIPGLSPRHAREGKKMAERVYPLIYLFENSARDVITQVLKAALGENWWLHVPTGVSNQAASNMKKEGEEAWHSTRVEPIQCVDLPQLRNIVGDDKLWPYFRPLFSRKSWLESVVDDINVSRRVVVHMNPLSSDDIKSIETGFRKWVKQLQAKETILGG